MSEEGAQAPQTSSNASDVQHLQAQVEELQHRIDRRETWRRRRHAARRPIAGFLVVLFCVMIVVTTIGTWTRQTLLRTNKFVDAVGPLPENPDVARALADFLTNELFVVINVRERAEEALPEEAQFLAVPLTDALQGYFAGTVDKVVASETFNRLWRGAIRIAHENAVAVLQGDDDAIVTQDGEVVLDLVPVVNQVLHQIEARVPEFFGRQVSLPELNETSARELRSRLENALGIELPKNFGQIKVFDEDELSQAQDAVHLMNRFVIASVVVTILLAGAALSLSGNRRRTILQLGLGTAIGIVVVFVVLQRVVADLLNLVPEGENRDAARAAARVVSAGLRDRAWYVLGAAVLVAVVAYVVGPGRGAVALRRRTRAGADRVQTGSRELPRTPLGRWVSVNLEGVRLGGVAVALVLVLVFEPSWAGLFLAVALLAAYEIGVTVLTRRASTV